MFTADNNLGQAAPTDVRSGVTYASGNLTGRLTIPARGTVASGVNLGPSMPFTATRSGTTATATLTYSYPYQAGDVITVTGASNNEWNGDYTITEVVSGTSVRWTVPATHSATAGTGANAQTKGTAVLDGSSVAAAVWGAASRTITGGLVDTVTTLTNAPTVPSAAAIASQVRTELGTELGRIDAAVSSRATPANIPTSDITAIKAKTDNLPALPAASGDIPTAAANATAVWSAATRTLTSSAGITASDVWSHATRTLTSASGPTALEIRTELDSNSTQLAAIKAKTDNLPASPAATGDIPSANITAIKAKTDALNTDRLAQVSTVSTTGAQLAAALS